MSESIQNLEDFNEILEMLAQRVNVYGTNLEQCKQFQISRSPSRQSTIELYNDFLSTYNTTDMKQLESELQELYLRSSKGCKKCTKACRNAISDVCESRDCSSKLKKKVKRGCKQACKDQFN